MAEPVFEGSVSEVVGVGDGEREGIEWVVRDIDDARR